ncbi:hypothetical protein D8M04_03040 [Oceanobacillus piezotolerans]|uniref:Uncharacterized protein n=1 Tax=Oceanobacillus piezotolerans TaxID=2448030 RepID=A0A498DFF2_9BACI|nr:hypothetical protein D8M04_03040 [Oceanobacillus piezotolerans]
MSFHFNLCIEGPNKGFELWNSLLCTTETIIIYRENNKFIEEYRGDFLCIS